jgi:hypothetical protein
MDVYEPQGTLEAIAPRVWTVNGPIAHMRHAGMNIPFPTRMLVAQLADDSLWIWSPTKPTEELFAELNALGAVKHLISPNKIHCANIAAWKTAYPSATAWASPGVRERATAQNIDVTFDRDLSEAADAAWSEEIDQLIFRGSRFLDEVVFFHRATRTLIVADLIENFESEKMTFPERLLMKFAGITAPDGKASNAFRATFLGHHDVARACFDRMCAWKPERIVIAHGRCYAKGADSELRRAFRWLD